MSERKVLFPLLALLVVAAVVALFTLTVLIAAVVVIAIIAVAVLAFLYLPLILPKNTSLVITPSTLNLVSGESMALTATPKSGGLTLTGTGTTWVASVGSFDRNLGSVVIFTVSEVTEPATVSITASFPGIRPYRSSKATITGTVVPRKAEAIAPAVSPTSPESSSAKMTTPNTMVFPSQTPPSPGPSATLQAASEVRKLAPASTLVDFSYGMQFGKLSIANAEVKGPIAMQGVNVVEITGSLVKASMLSLTPLGLSASEASFENMRMYATRVKASSPELGKTLELAGDEETKMSMSSLTLENGTASVVYLMGATVGLTKPELKGKHVGGNEPYTPVIATAHKVTLDQGYAVQGPTTYEELVGRSNNLMSGRIAASDFTFACPLKYNLDREAKESSYETKWTMSALALTGLNPSILFVYFSTTYGGFVMKGTGEQSPSTIIPHGFSSGWKSPPLPDAQVHAVYFAADQLVLKDLVIQITP